MFENRKRFIQSLGASCKNWRNAWSFVNHERKLVIFGAWDVATAGNISKILDSTWQRSNKGRRQSAYTESIGHLQLVEKQDYALATFPIEYAHDGDDSPSRIKSFHSQLTACSLEKKRGRWYARSTPILFCNTGWMKLYQGITRDDAISGGGSYVRSHAHGHEVCNFAVYRGKYYGFVRPNGDQIHIERLGADKTSDSIKGIDVVITARRPGGQTVIVGWYKNATVYRYPQLTPSKSAVHKKNKLTEYRFSAGKTDVVRIPPERRVFEIPRQKVGGGMGQSNVWYANSQDSVMLVSRVKKYIEEYRENPVGSWRSIRSKAVDPERNALVESIAVNLVREYYERLDYTVHSVEKDNVGWDIEAIHGSIKLLIEVKGLSGEIVNAQLTPNEYSAFCKENPNYRLAVVTCCLGEPHLHVFGFDEVIRKWCSNLDGSIVDLDIRESVAATIQLR
ncbi:MAG: DUF3883 domain-containing protein [Woeseiaceae bacterium]|nr:DUF3883 domain-containing protein [Woeseiaceae bacterium]